MFGPFNIRSINDYTELIDLVLSKIKERHIIALKGPLGAGKTTFVQQFVKALKKEDPTEVSSPSFGIVNEYQIHDKLIYHFDLYRIKDSDELSEFGFEEYLDLGDLIFIEWPDDFTSALPKEHVQWLTFEVDSNGDRKITLTYP